MLSDRNFWEFRTPMSTKTVSNSNLSLSVRYFSRSFSAEAAFAVWWGRLTLTSLLELSLLFSELWEHSEDSSFFLRHGFKEICYLIFSFRRCGCSSNKFRAFLVIQCIPFLVCPKNKFFFSLKMFFRSIQILFIKWS